MPLSTRVGSPKPKKRSTAVDSTTLDRDAWLRAAAAAIAEDGFNGTRILPLSKRLGVTRGSFYWHFADHAAFVVAFIERWRDQQLRAVESFKYPGDDPVAAYAALLDLVLTDTGAEQKRLKVEFALRGHARRDSVAAKAVAQVDLARTKLFRPMVAPIAANDDEADSLARLLLIQLSGAQHAVAGPKYDAAVLTGMKQAMLKSLQAMYTVYAASNSPKRAR